ncbi:MAG: type I methionyl aminopeptidase [Desulfatibacillaceae bacterium]|nr:type I methionyl aminopeptidase [Desulfatibacillaceae bacterium]
MVLLKNAREIELMRTANSIVAEILDAMCQKVAPGVTTLELDALGLEICRKYKVAPAFKGYRGFPFALCASVNEQVVHGFPSKRPLVKGDILSLDFGVLHKGFYGDAAVTVAVGQVDEKTARLLEVTRESLYAGIEMARPGNRLSDVGHAVQAVVEKAGFSVVRKFVGHGIGKSLHEEPQIPNYGEPGKGIRLKPGMTLAIEPMVNMGGHEVDILDDGWTAVTRDKSLSAHFEHTIAITPNGPDILSQRGGRQ